MLSGSKLWEMMCFLPIIFEDVKPFIFYLSTSGYLVNNELMDCFEIVHNLICMSQPDIEHLNCTLYYISFRHLYVLAR